MRRQELPASRFFYAGCQILSDNFPDSQPMELWTQVHSMYGSNLPTFTNHTMTQM